MSKHALARAGGALMPYREVDKDDPKTHRQIRRETSTDETSLDNRRVAYQAEGKLLREIQKTMKELRLEGLKISEAIRELEKRAKTEPENEKKGVLALEALHAQLREKEELYTDCYNMASLTGLTLLFEGQSLMIDMLSVEQFAMNRKTDKREYWRVSVADIAFDSVQGIESLDERLKTIMRMVNEVGMKQKIWHEGKYIQIKNGVEVVDEEEEPQEPVELNNPVGAGVPAEDLKVSQMTREKVIQLVRGEPKKE